MKAIIAGSRSITDPLVTERVIRESGWVITEVVCGKAKGPDTHGENWGLRNGIHVEPFEAKWNDLNAPGAVIRKNKYGYYNAVAGHQRNERMAIYADVLILIWDGKSTGSADMRKRAKNHGLMIFIYDLSKNSYWVE